MKVTLAIAVLIATACRSAAPGDGVAKQAAATLRTPVGELPPTRWRPELFLSSGGRLWMARGGLYSADSADGAWRLAFGRAGDPVRADALRIGINIAALGEDTLLIGMPSMSREEKTDPLAFRTTDRGRTWTTLTMPPDLAWIDAMSAAGRSVWLMGTRWENEARRGMLLVSQDAGTTWQRRDIPAGLNDVTGITRIGTDTAYVWTAGYNKGPLFWRTTDGAASWVALPTPHDQGVHTVPSYGVRVEHAAVIGRYLVVREYDDVFVSPADAIAWRHLPDVRYVAADHVRGNLFVLTESLQAAMLDRELHEIWRSRERIPDARPTNVEQVVAHDGTGYVSTSHSTVYVARDGVLRLVTPGGEGSSH